jgi:hypothetical protein
MGRQAFVPDPPEEAKHGPCGCEDCQSPVL